MKSFFFNDAATAEIYPLSLLAPLPIYALSGLITATLLLAALWAGWKLLAWGLLDAETAANPNTDRKSTRLNSSHGYISYAVFCLKKIDILIGSFPFLGVDTRFLA